jgi:hypothetical protein
MISSASDITEIEIIVYGTLQNKQTTQAKFKIYGDRKPYFTDSVESSVTISLNEVYQIDLPDYKDDLGLIVLLSAPGGLPEFVTLNYKNLIISPTSFVHVGTY